MPVDLNEFGHYRLIRRISLGGMAEVFKAKSYSEAGLEKVVALKRVLPTVAEENAFIEMFLQEAKVAAQLDHQNICRIYELGKVASSYYLSMEFIYGHDLREAMKAMKERRVEVDPFVAAWIAAKVAEGLDYAYRFHEPDGTELRVVHRDISPQNIMIGFDGVTKVIDFGIAKVANATIQTAAGLLKGKYGYISPEHARREALDARSDIWSLGVVMHELLSGRRLFAGDSIADTVEQVLHLPIPPLEGVPEGLGAIVLRMLDRDLGARYAGHDDVLSDLSRFLAGAPAPLSSHTVAAWMESLFPSDRRLEEDLTDEDVRVLLSAEERGEETTDQRRGYADATQIFLADTTGQADYRAVLERLLREGRVHTQVAAVPAAPSLIDRGPHERPGAAERVLWQALAATLGISLATWVLIALCCR